MNEAEMLFSITVPGSTANLGPGFDSIGMALSRYLKLSVFRNDEWQFSAETETVAGIPQGTDNLIYQVAKRTADRYQKELPPAHVKVWSDIPLRGASEAARPLSSPPLSLRMSYAACSCRKATSCT